ncbi:hypothetical protein RJT34_13887 [Clitoria ternatea]|uniref:Uncharacterized protein n=1 Tax=Clitoria ternatea TaxID=43366 RepID=A0AAN9PM85_CLITE
MVHHSNGANYLSLKYLGRKKYLEMVCLFCGAFSILASFKSLHIYVEANCTTTLVDLLEYNIWYCYNFL